MANRTVHIPAGILAPWLILLLYFNFQNRFPSAFNEYMWSAVAILISVAGFFGERTPETVEPPSNPKHRGTFHLFGGIATIYILLFFKTSPFLPWTSLRYEDLSGLLVISYLAGYASHFLLDYVIAG